MNMTVKPLQVNNNDPLAAETLNSLEAIKHKCMESGILATRSI